MGIVREVPPAALIAGILFHGREHLESALDMLTGEFGIIEMKSPVFDFDMTDYYTAEMGEGLEKQFICFARPVDMATLPYIKLTTNSMEMELACAENEQHSRRVNIDPGYVTLSKLVLATTKDYSHRIYIGRGIFAEVTLRFIRGTFSPLGTTYPDYKTPLAIEFFNMVRDFVKRNAKE